MIRRLAEFLVVQMVYVNLAPWTNSSVDLHISAKYNKVLPRTKEAYKVFNIRDHVLTTDETELANSFSIAIATRVAFNSSNAFATIPETSIIQHLCPWIDDNVSLTGLIIAVN